MGEPARDQIDEAIVHGVSRGHDDKTIVAQLATLEGQNDERLAAEGIFVLGYAPPARQRLAGVTSCAP